MESLPVAAVLSLDLLLLRSVLFGRRANENRAQSGSRHIITDDNMGAEWTPAPEPNWR